jgi:hypothetical protein
MWSVIRSLRWRLVLAVAALLAAAALAAVVLFSWGTEPPERAQYDRIQAGMTQDEVREILSDWFPEGAGGTLTWRHETWSRPDGWSIDLGFDAERRLRDKRLTEGDLSVRAKMNRLRRRLTSR